MRHGQVNVFSIKKTYYPGNTERISAKNISVTYQGMGFS